MADPHVNVTLTFRTNSPPETVAMAVGQAVTNGVLEQLNSINWNGFDLDEEEEAAHGDPG